MWGEWRGRGEGEQELGGKKEGGRLKILRKIKSGRPWAPRDPLTQWYQDTGSVSLWCPWPLPHEPGRLHALLWCVSSHISFKSWRGGKGRGQFLYLPSSPISIHGEETFSKSYLANTFFCYNFQSWIRYIHQEAWLLNIVGNCTVMFEDKQEGGGWEWLWVDPQEQSHLLIKHLE